MSIQKIIFNIVVGILGALGWDGQAQAKLFPAKSVTVYYVIHKNLLGGSTQENRYTIIDSEKTPLTKKQMRRDKEGQLIFRTQADLLAEGLTLEKPVMHNITILGKKYTLTYALKNCKEKLKDNHSYQQVFVTGDPPNKINLKSLADQKCVPSQDINIIVNLLGESGQTPIKVDIQTEALSWKAGLEKAKDAVDSATKTLQKTIEQGQETLDDLKGKWFPSKD